MVMYYIHNNLKAKTKLHVYKEQNRTYIEFIGEEVL